MILRTVDLHVTGGAVLESRGRLVVEARRIGRSDLVGSAVAFQAELAHLVALEQLGIGRAVRRVANRAAFQLQRRVLEDEGALLVGVTLHARCIGAAREAGLLCLEAAVRIVAVGALDHAFEYLVVKRLSELALHLGVTLDAQLGLICLQHLQRGDIRLDFGCW